MGVCQGPGWATQLRHACNNQCLHFTQLKPTVVTCAKISSSQNHRMAWVAKEHSAHPVPTPCYVQVTNQQPRLPRATSSLALNACRDGASTASLGNLFQCISTLWVKNFLLIDNLNLPCLSLIPFPNALPPDLKDLKHICDLCLCNNRKSKNRDVC